MSFAEELSSLRTWCNHKWRGLGCVEWGRRGHVTVKLRYCTQCLTTQTELIELSEEAVNRLLNLNLRAAFDMKVPNGVTLMDHFKDIGRLVRDLTAEIKNAVEVMPELSLEADAPIYSTVEFLYPTNEIDGIPIALNPNIPEDQMWITYGHHKVCCITFVNMYHGKRPMKQLELLPLNKSTFVTDDLS